MRKIFRIVRRILAVGILAMAAYLLLLAHPEPLFSYSVTYSNFTVFSNSELSPQLAKIVSDIDSRLSTSELYDPAIPQRVFVIGKSWMWTFFNGPYRHAIARNFELGNSIFVPQLDVANHQIRHFDGRHAEAVHVLTHEAVHTLVQRRIGLIQLWRLSWWQKEGYPEYIASKAATETDTPAAYQEAALVWKGLIENDHLTFDEIIRLKTPGRLR
jgi:hypothetical protein